MRKQMAEVDKVTPLNIGMTLLRFVGEGVRRLTDDLEQTFGSSLSSPVAVESGTAAGHQLAELFRSFEDVGNSQIV